MSDQSLSLEDVLQKMPRQVRQADLNAAWSSLAESLSLEPARGKEIIVAVPRDLTLQQNELTDSAWGGVWEWNLSDGIAKAAVVSALVAAALVAAGAGVGMAPVLIPTVVPLLFDVKRVRLERTAGNYLRIIGVRSDAAARTGTAASLYQSLPEAVRSAISQVDFESFLDLGIEAGHARRQGGTFEVLPNGETAFRIAIR